MDKSPELVVLIVATVFIIVNIIIVITVIIQFSWFDWLRPFFVWRFTVMSFSTRTRPFSRRTSSTLPDFPFSLPEMTLTVSPLRIWDMT